MPQEPLTPEVARALFDSGRLYELVGVDPTASPAEVKAACKKAYLAHHPDRGGNSEVFKCVFAASEQLRSDEHIFAFDGGVPRWAAWRVEQIKRSQAELKDMESFLADLRRKLENARADHVKVNLRWRIERLESGLEAASDAARAFRAEFVRLRQEHLEAVAEQKRKVERELQRQRDRLEEERRDRARELNTLRRRRLRGVVGNRFPTMPVVIKDNKARATLSRWHQEYTSIRGSLRRRARNGLDVHELEEKAADIMACARQLVRQACDEDQLCRSVEGGRFPRLPSSDPRSTELAALGRKSTAITKRFRKAMSEEKRLELEALRDDVFAEAVALFRRAAEAGR